MYVISSPNEVRCSCELHIMKKKDKSDEAGQGDQQLHASNDAIEVQPEAATQPAEEEQPEPAAAREEGRQRKRAKKQSDGLRVNEGIFRTEQFIDIPNQFALLKGSLKNTFDTLQGNKTRAKKLPVPVIDELKKICTAIGPLRASGFLLNQKKALFGADCLYIDLPSGLNLEVDDVAPPLWNVYYSKVEVFCKIGTDFQIPKSAYIPFDVDNTGRDSAIFFNYNTNAPKKLDDLGRRKCTGFVQTLLENFTKQGDIVIDFTGGWGATLQAAFNGSRCCIVAEERKDAYESLQLTLATIAKAKETLIQESSTQPETQPARSTRGKKPLGEDDDLGDDIFGDDE
ncbi:hypothetical protein R1sor_025833 [Riccia sorocarpa]|uniref:Trimethylguanosine synthase n=1 Tax=Riccia sorocarpa TaxID=122646 RepID=A0ABD3G9S1_9MARC